MENDYITIEGTEIINFVLTNGPIPKGNRYHVDKDMNIRKNSVEFKEELFGIIWIAKEEIHKKIISNNGNVLYFGDLFGGPVLVSKITCPSCFTSGMILMHGIKLTCKRCNKNLKLVEDGDV